MNCHFKHLVTAVSLALACCGGCRAQRELHLRVLDERRAPLAAVEVDVWHTKYGDPLGFNSETTITAAGVTRGDGTVGELALHNGDVVVLRKAGYRQGRVRLRRGGIVEIASPATVPSSNPFAAATQVMDFRFANVEAVELPRSGAVEVVLLATAPHPEPTKLP